MQTRGDKSWDEFKLCQADRWEHKQTTADPTTISVYVMISSNWASDDIPPITSGYHRLFTTLKCQKIDEHMES